MCGEVRDMSARLIWLIVMLVHSVAAHAERAPEPKDSANVVVTGVVERITSFRYAGNYSVVYYDVHTRAREIKRSSLEAKLGDMVIVRVFQQTLEAGMVGASGHRHLPAVGDTIVAYANWEEGGYDGQVAKGVYPKWYDAVAPTPLRDMPRTTITISPEISETVGTGRVLLAAAILVTISFFLGRSLFWLYRRRPTDSRKA